MITSVPPESSDGEPDESFPQPGFESRDEESFPGPAGWFGALQFPKDQPSQRLSIHGTGFIKNRFSESLKDSTSHLVGLKQLMSNVVCIYDFKMQALNVPDDSRLARTDSANKSDNRYLNVGYLRRLLGRQW